MNLSKQTAAEIERHALANGGSVTSARAVEKRPRGMNKNEQHYAEHLEALRLAGEIRRWDYEWITFVLAFDCRWTPDFVVITKDWTVELHDCKGAKRGARGEWVPWIEEDARIKLRVAGTHFPFIVKAVWFAEGVWQEKEFK